MTVKSVQSNVVKIAQTFAFGRRKANHGGLPGLTIGFFQQSLDSWRAFYGAPFVSKLFAKVLFNVVVTYPIKCSCDSINQPLLFFTLISFYGW